MISLEFELDVAGMVKEYEKAGRQLPFIMALAINNTNELKQRQIHEHVFRVLAVRREQKTFREVIRYGRENKADSKAGKLMGQIVVLGEDERARSPKHGAIAAILLRQNDGGQSSSSALYRAQSGQLTVGGFTVPSETGGFERTATTGVPAKLYPKNLGLAERRAIDGGGEFANQGKGGMKRGGFKRGTAYYFVMEDVGIFERKPIKKNARQLASRKPKKFKRGTSIYFAGEAQGALNKMMRDGTAEMARPNAKRSRRYDDMASDYTQIWHFQRTIDLPKRVDILGVFQENLEDTFASALNNAFVFAMATAR